MNDYLSRYALFLAETLTLVVVIVGLVALAMRMSRRGRGRYRLSIRNVNRRYDEMANALTAQLEPKRVVKQRVKADRRRRKAEDRARRAPGGPRKPRMFVLDFRGDVRATQATSLREEVTALLTIATEQDEVLVRLENAGGLVHDQGFAASQLLRVRQRRIPLTVAVDKIAASGGYMMACVADRILAAPFAVVGSIGVIAQVPNVHRLLDRHGVDVELFKGGEFKRTVTMFGENTDADREKLQEEIHDTHALFKEFVAAHRPQVDVAAVGTGEHWYGTRALERHLVDELVTSDDYLLNRRGSADIFEVSCAQRRSARRRLASLMSGLPDGLLDTRWAYR
jgi:serine protease SohB